MLTEALRVPVVAENRPGADGIIGAQEAARGAPDGHTLFMGGIATHALNDLMDPNRSFRADRVLSPVIKVGASPMVLVASPALSVASIAEVLDRARTRPGALRYATAGPLARLTGEMIRESARVDMVEVPYRSQGQETTQLIAGEIELSLTFASVMLSHLQAGRLRPLAVAARQRHGALPQVPTFAESGLPEVEATGWIGIFVHAQTPQPIVQSIHQAFAKAIQSNDMREEFLRTGVMAGGESTEEFAAFIRSEVDRFGRLIRERGIKFN